MDKPAALVTVRDLCQAVSARLPELGFHSKRCWLASLQERSKCLELDLDQLLLRDLRWTQSERLELREAHGFRR